MALVAQMLAVSYPAVLAEMRKPANQWAESAFMAEYERLGGIVKKSLGPTIELPIDYQRNQGTDFLATDMTETSLSKTEVITTASYTPVPLTVPILWSKMDEALNPSENQKVALVKSLLENAINSHDDAIEEALFGTTTDGFLGLQTIVPDSGQGTVGGIDAATELFWRNYSATYQSDGSDMESALTTAMNTASKGSGATLGVKLLVSGVEGISLFESTQQSFQRYSNTNDLKAGFKTLEFKAAKFIFSHYGGTRVYGLNPKTFQVIVSKQFFRDKGDTNEIDNANAYVTKIFSALQSVTNNKSRLFVLTQA